MHNRLKILCFHPALAPYRVDFFNLLAEKVELEVVFLRENLENQKFDQQALRAQAKFSWRLLTNGFDIRSRYFRFGMTRIIREVRPDVILSYEAAPITAYLCLLRRFASWRLWTSMDEAAVTITSRTGVRAFVRDWVLRHVDGVIVPSDEAADAYRQVLSRQSMKKVPAFAVVPIIHDTASLRKDETAVFAAGAAWRREFVPRDWTRLVIFVGRLSPEKNLSWLIAQMASVPQGTGLVLVGDGPLRAELEAQVAAAGLGGRVRFAGRLEGTALYATMVVSDVLALASTSEPFGAVVAEGLAWGTPVVVSEFVGAKSLVTSENGRVFSLTPESFAEALRTVPPPKPKRRSLLPVDLRSAVERWCATLA